MRVIDSHVHLYPPEANLDPVGWGKAHGETNWVAMSARRRKNGTPVQSFPSLAELLAEMDAAGIERSVLLGWYWQRAETCAKQNRFFADCVRKHPDRISAFATVLPLAGREDAVTEMVRARDEGLVGLGELSPHAQGYSIDDDVFDKMLELAGNWRWPVNVHVTDPNSRDYAGRVETPLKDFTQLAKAHPGVVWILAHWGGLLPLRDPEAAGLENVYYDSPASPMLYDETVWERMLAAVPPERLLFGSDFPLNLYPKLDVAASARRLIAEAARAKVPVTVMRENVLRLLPGL
jgi:predicted TIM-barrel fold metal-dependent hydrolase